MNVPAPSSEVDLEALLHEQRRQWEKGNPIRVEAILEKHPALNALKEALLDLINHEIVLRGEFGDPAERGEYLRRFPSLAADLATLFDLHDAIEGDHDSAAPSDNSSQNPTVTGHDDVIAPTVVGTGVSPTTAPAAWPRIPNYSIVRILGEGGMGVVYQALDQRLKRTVALKMIRAGRAGTEERRRFQIEAEAVAKLDHPCIAQIYDIGEHDYQPFIALEYIDGDSLACKLEGAPQPPREAARLVETLARGVHFAHSQGIIHRDLKPANILLQKIGDSPSQRGDAAAWIHKGIAYLPKIADFGLAKHIANDRDATQTQAIVGTPSYMAPEQAGDFSRRIGPAADVYSLGAILYELITGRPPFRGESVLDTLDQVRSQQPIAPTRLQPKAPRDLETICLKCLRKVPGQRYESAEALAEDLGRFLRHEPIQARPTPLWQRLWLWCKRRPALALLYFTIAAGILFGFPLITYLWRRAVDGEQRALDAKALTDAKLYDERIKSAQHDWKYNLGGRMKIKLESLRPGPGEPDRRGFEWHYLWGLLRKGQAQVEADACLAYSPDGKVIAAPAKDDINLWKVADLDKPDPQPIARLHGHTSRIITLAFSHDGAQIVSAAADRTVRQWNVAKSVTAKVFPVLPADISRVACSPVDGTIAIACADGLIRMWEDEPDPRLVADHKAPVNDIAFSADGGRLISAGDKNIIVWDVATGDVKHKLHGDATTVHAVAVHGNRLASAGLDRFVRLWDFEKGTLLHKLRRMPNAVDRLAFRADGKRLAGACRDRSIPIWNTDPAVAQLPDEPIVLLRGHSERAVSLAFSPIEDRLASVGKDHTLRLWDPNQDPECVAYDLPTGGNGMALSPNSSWAAVAGHDKKVHLVDWRTGTRKALAGHTGVVESVEFSNDGVLVSAGWDGKAIIWDIEKGTPLRELRGSDGPIVAMAVAPDGRLLVTGSKDGVVRFWDTGAGRLLDIAPAQQGIINDFVFDRQGRMLASAGQDGAIRLHDPATGIQTHHWSETGHTPIALAFSLDGGLLACGDVGSTVRIWDVHSRRRIHLLEGHDEPVQALAFSQDSKRLATASADGSLKIWDLTTGLELLTLRGHGRNANGVAFAPNDDALISLGRTAATPTYQGQLRVWPAHPKE